MTAKKKKIDLKFGKLSRKQVSEIAKNTLISGGMEIADDLPPPQPPRARAPLSDAFNRAAGEREPMDRPRTEAAMPRFDPAI